MKHQVIRRALPLLALGVSLLAHSAQDDWGKNRYDCQVTTIHDRQGYIGVRADSMDEAVIMAGGAKEAVTRLETQEPAKEVVQCVQWPNGKFTDVGFQVWLDALPK